MRRTRPARLPVMVKGKRIKTIDVHAHCFFQQAIDLMGEDAKNVPPPVKGVKEHFIVVEERLKEMDEMAIDMEVLSINPFWYRKDRDIAEAICKIKNEKLAELCASKPDRFAAFASLADAVSRPRGAAARDRDEEAGPERRRDRRQRARRGVRRRAISPGLKKAEELGAVLFIHPQSTPQLAPRFKGNGWLSNTIGNPLDTTIALQHLIFEGTLDKFPGLKVLAAHGGGYLPSYAMRGDHACFVSPQNCNPTSS